MAKALIEAGADLEITSSEGSTPLHVAAFFCRTEIAKALLDSGANKYLRDNYGNTPLESVSAPFEDVEDIYDTILVEVFCPSRAIVAALLDQLIWVVSKRLS